METMHLTDDELVAHYYGEMSDAAEHRACAHLDGCASCREEVARLKRVMAAIDSAVMPVPADDFEQTVWKRLVPAMAKASPAAGALAWSAVRGSKGWLAMAAGLLLAAFVAGRMWPASPPPTQQVAASAPDSPRERVLLVDLSSHLDRTEQALVEFIGRGTPAGADGQARVTDLVAANRLYRGTAEATGDQAVTDVLDELERVLVEIASTPADAPPRELDGIRRRIDSLGLLFKLRVMRMQLQQRVPDARPATKSGTTL